MSYTIPYTQYRKGSLPGGTADTDQNISPNIWAPAQRAMAQNDGVLFWDDFTDFNDASVWTLTQATAGTIASIAGKNGVVAMDSASTTADQGVQMQAGMAFKPVAGSTIYYETRVSISDTPIANTQFFAGLSIIDTTIMAAGANSSTDHMGYEMNALTQAGTVGTAGTANFYGEKAGTRNTAAANVGLDVHLFTDGGVTDGQTTVATAGWVKLGFVVDGVTNIKCYVNGVYTGDVIPTANVSILALAPSFVCQTEGTTDPVTQIDWVRCFQSNASTWVG